MLIKKNSSCLFVGDSITDCNRSRPIGRGTGLGDGYVKLIHGFLNSTYPDYRLSVINMGNSGDTIRDLKKRWKSDVIDLNPDWLSIMIGINDVWRQFDDYFSKNCIISIEEYTETLDCLVDLSKKTIPNIILMTPYFIEPRTNDPMRKTMNLYGHAVKKIAVKYNILLVDIQKQFDAILKFIPTASLALDRVHPNIVGHSLIAKIFLHSIDFDFSRNLII